MKKYSPALLIFFLLNICTFGQSDSTRNPVPFTSSNLPIVVINTNGQVIINEEKINVDMGIIDNGPGVRNYITDPYNNYDGRAGIEIRGSSSQMFPKKQYGFETRDSAGNDIKVSLLGLPSESDWILFAPYNDKSLIRDALAYRVANDMGRYASRSRFVELVLNTQYMGVYVLFEKVKRDGNRVNVKKLEPQDTTGDALTGGYIIKIDKPDGENNEGWLSGYLPFPERNFKIQYIYHYPKPDDIVPQQSTYIKNYIYNFETMMKYSSNISDTAAGYPKFIDTDSFIDFILLNEVVKNVDAYRLSTYLYKDRDSRNPKMFAGPVWDFNLAWGNADYYEGGFTAGWDILYITNPANIPQNEPFLTPFWWRKLFEDQSFRIRVNERWQTFKQTVLNYNHINSHIDSLTTLLNEAKTRNFERWPVLGIYVWPNFYVGQTYQDEIIFLKTWINNRLHWLDLNMVGSVSDAEYQEELNPGDFHLAQNYPNPFNPVTAISYNIPEAAFVNLKIFDLLGNEIAVLVKENINAGTHKIHFDASNLPSGIYIYKLQAGNRSIAKKMMVLK